MTELKALENLRYHSTHHNLEQLPQWRLRGKWVKFIHRLLLDTKSSELASLMSQFCCY